MAFSDHRFTSQQQKQRICCILSSIITNSKDLKVIYAILLYNLILVKYFNYLYLQSNQLGLVFAFIVRWQQEDGNFIKPDKHVFETVTTMLTSSEQTTPLEDREKAFIQLIRSGAFDDNPDLLKIADQAKLLVKCFF